jgi:hypothetical protein
MLQSHLLHENTSENCFEDDDKDIDISHFGSFEIVDSRDEMRIRAAARAKELDAFKKKMENKSKSIREKAEAKAKRTENFLKLRQDLKMQARFINDQQSRERARIKERAQKLLSSGKLLELNSLDSLTRNSNSLQNIDLNNGMMMGFQNSSLWDNDKVLIEEGDEYYDDDSDEDGNNILDIEDEQEEDCDDDEMSTPKDSLDKCVIDFETGEKIKLINKSEIQKKKKISKEILRSASSILSTNAHNDYLVQQKAKQNSPNQNFDDFNDNFDNTSSIISIRNRPNTIQSLRRKKSSQITMQTKRPRPSYGKRSTDIINERIERIRLARSKTANHPKQKTDHHNQKPLVSDFTTSSSSGFLPGPKARRKLGRQARHVYVGNLAFRELKQPKPKTFFEKEFAKHSMQSYSISDNQNSNDLSRSFEQLEAVRKRQLESMDRLLKEERALEVERQAMEASDTSKLRRRRLQLKFVKDREKARHRILRIAKEHELALASRMASMGLIR